MGLAEVNVISVLSLDLDEPWLPAVLMFAMNLFYIEWRNEA